MIGVLAPDSIRALTASGREGTERRVSDSPHPVTCNVTCGGSQLHVTNIHDLVSIIQGTAPARGADLRGWPRATAERPAVERITAEQRGHRGNELHPVQAVTTCLMGKCQAPGGPAAPIRGIGPFEKSLIDSSYSKVSRPAGTGSTGCRKAERRGVQAHGAARAPRLRQIGRKSAQTHAGNGQLCEPRPSLAARRNSVERALPGSSAAGRLP